MTFFYLLFKSVPKSWIYLISGLFSFCLFGVIILYFKIDQPDLLAHITISNEIVDKKLFPVHPVFFGLVQLLSFFSKNYQWQLVAAFFLFAIAQYFKLILSLRLVQELFDLEASWLLLGLVVLLQVAIPIPFFSENFMIKSLSMNYFHNATLHVSIPFSLGLMLNLVRYHKTDDVRYFRYAFYFGILNCLAKPSFIFCLAPVLPFVALYFYGLTPKLLKVVQLSTIMVVIILLQSAYLHSTRGSELATFQVKFQPFFLFDTALNHLRVVFEGFFIGLLILVFYFKRLIVSIFHLAGLGFVLLGYFISFTFVDYIDNVISPNFTWQSSIANYVFVLMGIGFFVPSPLNPKWTLATLICMLALLAHAISGLLYLRMACLLRIFYLSM